MSGSSLETPMMRQYRAIKERHPDAILFYRMGDFYEMFLRDAELAAPLLDIALTTRDKGREDPVPMCGVPVHSADAHLRRLTELGHRVAICEQVEDARSAGRRLVRREVVEVVTPGLLGDPACVAATEEVGLAALFVGAGETGLAVLEASTGDFRATRLETSQALPPLLAEELLRVAPRELLLVEGGDEIAARIAELLPDAALTRVDPVDFDPARAPARPLGLDPAGTDAAQRAAAALLCFLAAHQPFALGQATRLRHYQLSEAMVLDAATRSHLELFESQEDGSRRGTLIERIDWTCTPMGARRMARWVAYPLIDPAAIRARQQAVAWLAESDRLRARVREALGPVRDLERRLAKVARPSATPRDLAALRASLRALPGVVAELETGGSELWGQADASRPASLPHLEAVPEALEALEEGLVEDPPALPRGSRGALETGYILAGHRPELDRLRESARKGREWIAGLEGRERERSGIPNLRVRFHPVHGYSLEVTKAQLARVPAEYERKQTLASVERFTTSELREAEHGVLGARERAAALERELFEALRQETLGHGAAIQRAAEAVSELDGFASLAEVARAGGWVRPEVDAGLGLEIRGGRHPVVEASLRGRGGEDFVPNDTDLDPEAAQLLLLTGPNMSGKSTYLRQVALNALLAQIGSYVPAEAARVGVVDRIFTRVGASDRLARGESTFLVEMRETAEILAQASPRSLVILDEIGRGTATFDGLSIAWAVAEHLHDAPGLRPRTLFATHYHELTDLERIRPRVRNAHFQVREWEDQVIFLRRLAAGGANRSYGIQVARLAGLPEPVVARAREILANLEGGELDAEGQPRLAGSGSTPSPPGRAQLDLFTPSGSAPPLGAAEREVLAALRALDPERTTPLEALAALERWVLRLSEEDPE
ncbi:MAG: DNA mismatch repair protein MutS [Myxococcota bacterium]